MSSEELKPCSICQGEAYTDHEGDFSSWYAGCNKCEITTHGKWKDERFAIKAWNKISRPASPVDGDLVERLCNLLNAVSHVGIDFGHGEYHLSNSEIAEAQELYGILNDRIKALQGQEGGE